VVGTIEPRNRWQREVPQALEGKTTTFSLRACPSSVEVPDESAIPAEYKTLTLKLPAVTWELLRALVLRQVRSPESSVANRSIKAALDGGADVPGPLQKTRDTQCRVASAGS
jgi:hypothetical protein